MVLKNVFQITQRGVTPISVTADERGFARIYTDLHGFARMVLVRLLLVLVMGEDEAFPDEAGLTEVDQEPHRIIRGFQIVQHLGHMIVDKSCDGFDLQDDPVVTNKIGHEIFLKILIFVFDPDLLLTLKRDLFLVHLFFQCLLIDRLQEPIPQLLMNTHTRPDDLVSLFLKQQLRHDSIRVISDSYVIRAICVNPCNPWSPWLRPLSPIAGFATG